MGWVAGNFSYSRIETMKNCPFSYMLKYEKGINPYVAGVATEFGTIIHEAEEAIAKNIIKNEKINYLKIKNDFIAKLYAFSFKHQDVYDIIDPKCNKSYRMKAYDYLDSGIYRLEHFMNEHPTYQLLGAEVNFSNVDINGHLFGGAIDRVIYDTATGQYICHDIKSWSEPKDEKDLVTPLQFVVYAKALEKLYGTDPNNMQCFYDLPICDMFQAAGTKGFINRGIKQLDTLFAEIESKDFKPKTSALCNWCTFSRHNPEAKAPYKYLCPYTCAWHRDTRDKADFFKKDYEFNSLEEYPIILENYCKQYNVGMCNLDEFVAYYKEANSKKKGNEVKK